MLRCRCASWLFCVVGVFVVLFAECMVFVCCDVMGSSVVTSCCCSRFDCLGLLRVRVPVCFGFHYVSCRLVSFRPIPSRIFFG